MHGFSRPSVLVTLWIGVLAVLGGTSQASASADNEDETIEAAAPQRGGRRDPDFLFGPPRRWVGVRGSWLFARADSEIFDFTRDLLTIEKTISTRLSSPLIWVSSSNRSSMRCSPSSSAEPPSFPSIASS